MGSVVNMIVYSSVLTVQCSIWVMGLLCIFMLMMQRYSNLLSLKTMRNEKCLQKVISEIKEWCDIWLLNLNVIKCKVISYRYC